MPIKQPSPQPPTDALSRLSDQLTRRYPLLWISLAFLAGILIASQVHLAVIVWLILAIIALTAAIFHRPLSARLQFLNLQPSTFLLLLLSIIAFFLGAARYQATIPHLTERHIAWYNDRDYEILVTGVITEPPDRRDTYTNLRLRVTEVNAGDEALSVHGLILARIPPGEVFHYGEVLHLRGHLQTPPEDEDFSYRDYLARQNVHAYMPDAAATRLPFYHGNPILAITYAIKDHALATIYKIFPDPEAPLLAGILLGVDTGLPAGLQQAFRDTGTTHIIAISGFNITIIAGLFITLFNRLLGQRRGTVASVLGIAAYTLLVGAEPSVVRAAIMGGLGLFAWQVGRRQTAINTLAITAAVMTLFNPNLPWDLGFQLSFGATLGLILYAEPFQQLAVQSITRFSSPGTAQQIIKPLSTYLLFTLAAQLTTLPLLAYHFKRISLVALLANTFILPAQPPVMILGGLALLLSLFYLPLGQLAAWLAWPFTVYTTRMVEFFARLPHGVLILGDFSLFFVVLFYTALLAWTFAGERIKTTSAILFAKLKVSTFALLSALAVLTFLIWRTAVAAPDARLHLTFFDVGSADAILIQTPTGRFVLVNGGPSPARLSDGLGRRLSPFDRRLDYLVLGSTQENQVGALPRTLERYPPRAALWAGKAESSYSASQIDKWLTDNDIPVTRAETGYTLDLGNGARLRILATGSRGAIFLVEWRSFRALLPIGLNFETLGELGYGQSVGAVTVLLLAESGYAPVNPPDLIYNLSPRVIILSVATGDPNGLPAPETLSATQEFNLLRTDQNGWIQITTDGNQIWVETEKGYAEQPATPVSEQPTQDEQ